MPSTSSTAATVARYRYCPVSRCRGAWSTSGCAGCHSLGASEGRHAGPLPRRPHQTSGRRPAEPSGYGWNGGTGTVWTTDPDYGLTGIVLSTRAMTSPEPPAHMVDFWQAAYGALAG